MSLHAVEEHILAMPATEEHERGRQIHIGLGITISNSDMQIHFVMPWKWFENLTTNFGEI